MTNRSLARAVTISRLLMLDDLQALIDKIEADDRRSMDGNVNGVDAARCVLLLRSIGVENLDVNEGVGIERNRSKRS